ncbi:unnamed protein product [Cyprideis torosa]|uniref:Uncharacterized protein n=1 Tax=Cyprideis torosa TaxID=163714 RepID=A0A7R8ZIP1_9CRUS|nr:unnamed protein product [Cyprideis torosa]CAG0880397.1 unnamed protein product [Cyprideis torosa]
MKMATHSDDSDDFESADEGDQQEQSRLKHAKEKKRTKSSLSQSSSAETKQVNPAPVVSSEPKKEDSAAGSNLSEESSPINNPKDSGEVEPPQSGLIAPPFLSGIASGFSAFSTHLSEGLNTALSLATSEDEQLKDEVKRQTEEEKNDEDKKGVSSDGSPSNKGDEASSGLSSWGMNLFSQVKRGVETAAHKFEAGLGIPSPEDLVAAKDSPEGEVKEYAPSSSSSSSQAESPLGQASPTSAAPGTTTSEHSLPGVEAIGGAASSLFQGLKGTGTKVISGGLNTLEKVGKFTMTGVQEANRMFHHEEAESLSSVLKEAASLRRSRDEGDGRESAQDQHGLFAQVFDRYQGLSHLEALGILSSRCSSKVDSFLSDLPVETQREVKRRQVEMKDAYRIIGADDDENEEETAKFIGKPLTEVLRNDVRNMVPTASSVVLGVASKFSSISEEFSALEASFSEESPRKSHSVSQLSPVRTKALDLQAQFAAVSVELFHKLAERMLLAEQSESSSVTEANMKSLKTVVELRRCLAHSLDAQVTSLCNIVHRRYPSKATSDSERKKLQSEADELSTTLFLEASQAEDRMNEAYHLMLPVLERLILVTPKRKSPSS